MIPVMWSGKRKSDSIREIRGDLKGITAEEQNGLSWKLSVRNLKELNSWKQVSWWSWWRPTLSKWGTCQPPCWTLCQEHQVTIRGDSWVRGQARMRFESFIEFKIQDYHLSLGKFDYWSYVAAWWASFITRAEMKHLKWTIISNISYLKVNFTGILRAVFGKTAQYRRP